MRKSRTHRIQSTLDRVALKAVDAIPDLLARCEPEAAARLAVRLAIALMPSPDKLADQQDREDAAEMMARILATTRAEADAEDEQDAEAGSIPTAYDPMPTTL